MSIVYHPMTDKVFADTSEPDSCCELIAVLDREIKKLSEARTQLRIAIIESAEGDAMTRHVLGLRWKAKIVTPPARYDSTMLGQLATGYPEYFESHVRTKVQYSAISSQVKKLERSSGDPKLLKFRDAINAAKKPDGMPSVTVEKIEQSMDA